MSGLTEEQERTGRLYLRLPHESIAELSSYIEHSGVTRSNFLAMAVMLGGRALHRSLNPGSMLTPTVVEQMTSQMMGVFSSPDMLEKIVKMAGPPPGLPPESK